MADIEPPMTVTGKHQQLIGGATATVYTHGIKPLLFMQKPDAVHAHLLKTGGFVQRIPLARAVLRASWAYENPAYLSQMVAGIPFRNPIGLSAGFDKNCELLPLLKSVGFGFMEGGSVTFEPCAGNPKPWFHRLPNTKSLVVHVGLANQGVTAILARLAGYSAAIRQDFPLNLSVAKTNAPNACTTEQSLADYLGSLAAIKRSNEPQLITINISCPNTYGGEPFTTPDRLEKLLHAVDDLCLDQPLFIKMPALTSWKAARALLDVAASHRVAGVTLSNLAKDRSRIQLKDPLPDSIAGGLSGKPTWDISNELIRQTYRTYGERFVIIGVGGVFNAEDAYTKIKLGANLVELITGMIFQGPQLIGQINRGLVGLLERDGFTNVSQAVGVDA